jgi:hypothetical protein
MFVLIVTNIAVKLTCLFESILEKNNKFVR